MQPQVFDLLLFLSANRDRVVSKDDLVAGVWGNRAVSDSALNSRINAARKAISDDGKAQRLIRTIPRKGFRFVGDCKAHATLQPRRRRDAEQPLLGASDRPAIAVLASRT